MDQALNEQNEILSLENRVMWPHVGGADKVPFPHILLVLCIL